MICCHYRLSFLDGLTDQKLGRARMYQELRTIQAKKWVLSTVVVLTAFVACANASPTIDPHEATAPTEGPYFAADTLCLWEIGGFTKITGSELADIGRKLLKPLCALSPIKSERHYVRSLPAVPAAIFMAVIGFACVSLIRDCKAWSAVFACLLSLPQAGVAALPQLRLCTYRSRCVQPQGIACGYAKSAYTNITGSWTWDFELLYGLGSSRQSQVSFYATENNVTSHGIPPQRYWFNQLLKRPFRDTELFVCFTPTLASQNVARGPPCQRRGLASLIAKT